MADNRPIIEQLDTCPDCRRKDAEIERLRAAGDAMAEWLSLDVAHYEECATMHSDWPEMCDCGADKLRRAWEESRRG